VFIQSCYTGYTGLRHLRLLLMWPDFGHEICSARLYIRRKNTHIGIPLFLEFKYFIDLQLDHIVLESGLHR